MGVSSMRSNSFGNASHRLKHLRQPLHISKTLLSSSKSAFGSLNDSLSQSTGCLIGASKLPSLDVIGTSSVDLNTGAQCRPPNKVVLDFFRISCLSYPVLVEIYSHENALLSQVFQTNQQFHRSLHL